MGQLANSSTRPNHRKIGYLPKLCLQLMNLTSLNTRGHFIESAANKYRYLGDYCEQAHIGIKQKLMIDTILKHFVYMLHVGRPRPFDFQGSK